MRHSVTSKAKGKSGFGQSFVKFNQISGARVSSVLVRYLRCTRGTACSRLTGTGDLPISLPSFLFGRVGKEMLHVALLQTLGTGNTHKETIAYETNTPYSLRRIGVPPTALGRAFCETHSYKPDSCCRATILFSSDPCMLIYSGPSESIRSCSIRAHNMSYLS